MKKELFTLMFLALSFYCTTSKAEKGTTAVVDDGANCNDYSQELTLTVTPSNRDVSSDAGSIR